MPPEFELRTHPQPSGTPAGVAPNHQSGQIPESAEEILLTVYHGMPLGPVAGHQDRTMLEAVTAFFGVMSMGVFIAHAIDGYRSRP
jgi:hypothetical protein